MTTTAMRTCLITGARGYLGEELCLYLRKAGWRVMGTSRHAGGDDMVQFSLDRRPGPGPLAGIDALVHCAYDFGPCSWEEIYQTNVIGTRMLLREAKQAAIKTIITISSISAFTGCRSLYGKAKLQIEEETFAVGGIVLRPGLVYGGRNRGMYGRLVKQVLAGRPVPLLTGSPCVQYLVHMEDLCGVIEALLSEKVPTPASAWTVAHDRPWPLKELLTAIAASEGRKVRFIPVPWQFVWLGLKCLEGLGLKLGFKSDSVRSLAYQNPRPELGRAERAGLTIRDFRPGQR